MNFANKVLILNKKITPIIELKKNLNLSNLI